MIKKCTHKQLKAFVKMIEAKDEISREEYDSYMAAKKELIYRKRIRRPFYAPSMNEFNAEWRSSEIWAKLFEKSADK